MSLTVATLIFGLALLAAGAALLFGSEQNSQKLLHFAKSRVIGVILLIAASCWFLWHVTLLGEADFGEYKRWLFLFFTLVAIGSALYLPEYLTIRSLAALALLAATPFLDAAFNQPYLGRLFMVSGIYLIIFVSLYLAISPYRWRDFFQWLYRKPARCKIAGGILSGYGVISLAAIFSY